MLPAAVPSAFGGLTMNVPRIDLGIPTEIAAVDDDALPSEGRFRSYRNRRAESRTRRLERDAARGYLPQTHWLVRASEVRLWGEADTCVCRKLRFGPLEQDRARRHSSTAAARLLVGRLGSNRQRISTVVGDAAASGARPI
jgi:hypothetical protein